MPNICSSDNSPFIAVWRLLQITLKLTNNNCNTCHNFTDWHLQWVVTTWDPGLLFVLWRCLWCACAWLIRCAPGARMSQTEPRPRYHQSKIALEQITTIGLLQCTACHIIGRVSMVGILVALYIYVPLGQPQNVAINCLYHLLQCSSTGSKIASIWNNEDITTGRHY